MNAPAHPNRIKRGPKVGAPPSLEQIPLDRLQVDQAYQRATDSHASRRIIVNMVKRWDWALCQPLVVARRTDGGLFILDGQHRHAGALERGDIDYLPCVILSSLDHRDEASTFVKLNTERQALTQPEVFHGMLASGDPNAKAVQDLLDSTGWECARHTNTASYKVEQLGCAPMLVRTLKAKGDAPVRFALTSLRAAYPDTPVRQSATMIKALLDVFDRLCDDPDLAKAVPTAKLITTIGAAEPETWVSRGIIYRSTRPAMSMTGAIAATMIAAAQGKDVPSAQPIGNRTEPHGQPTPVKGPASAFQLSSRSTSAAPSAPARRAPPAANPFLTPAAKAWCTQCEQLRSKQAAAACGSQFCTLRRHT